MRYSIDTSALIEAWVRVYPKDIFPTWWRLFQDAVNQDLIKASQMVLLELENKDDDLYKWARTQQNLFIPIQEDIQIEVKNILDKHPRLVENRKQRSGADPFVIALAKIHNASVITNEAATGKSDKPNIPDVCNTMKISCLRLTDFMREMKWQI